MNYLAHARDILDAPWELVGTAVPDWLGHTRPKARPVIATGTPLSTTGAAIASGIARHLDEDAWFHANPTFRDLERRAARELNARPAEGRRRASFTAHIAIELLLDGALIAEDPQRVDRYYDALDRLTVESIADEIAATLPPSTTLPTQLREIVNRFLDARFLDGYTRDEELAFRIEQVHRRVGLVTGDLLSILPDLRRAVYEAAPRLLPPADLRERAS